MPPADAEDETEYAGSNELFVHGCAYDFSGDGNRKPLALIYNLDMDKSSIEGRDRAGLPRTWETDLRLLIKEAPESVFDRLVQLRKLHREKFYEFRNQNINNYINGHVLTKAENIRRIKAEAERANRAAEIASIEQADSQREVQVIKEKCQSAEQDGEASIHVRHHEKELVASQEEERIAAKRAEQLQAVAAEKNRIAEAASVFDAPTVLLFSHGEEVPPGVRVQPLHITSTKDQKWVRSEVPTLEEFLLMKESIPPIERKYTPLVRQLRRLLYVTGLESEVNIDHVHASMSATTLAVLHDTTLHVRFDATQMDVLQAAIQTLCSAGLFTKLIGHSADEAMAQVSNLMLQLTPEEPKEIAKRSSIVRSRGEMCSSAVVNPFCPLLVATEWDTTCGGISSFNIQLAKGLAGELRSAMGCSASTRTVVYVIVLGTDKADDTTRDQWNYAAQFGIKIVEGSRLRGVYTPCLTPSEFARVTHIVGHAHITGTEAADMRQLQQLQHVKLWQINHVLPLEADILKEGGTAQSRQESARKKEEILVKLNAEADHVFSVGAMMYDHFEHKLDKRGRTPDTNHTQLILPLNPEFLELPTMKHDFPGVGRGSIHILYFGRTESVFFLKGLDIAMRAVEQANKDKVFSKTQRVIELTVRGTKAGMEAPTVQKLIALQKDKCRDVAPYVACFTSAAEVMADLHQTHMVIMPSRNEPFGLVAMEAIACRVPVLVSGNSGVARLLTQHNMDRLCVQTSAHHPDDAAASAQQADVDAWSTAILELIAEGPVAFKRARTLAATLKESLPPPYSEMIKLGNGCTPSASNLETGTSSMIFSLLVLVSDA